MKTPAIDRLLRQCVMVGDCWQFTGKPDRKGYARLRDDSGTKRFGHRLTFEYFIGPIPDGLTFDHLTCQNTSCVNPWHGDLVPMLVNVARARRGSAVANRAKLECDAGHPLSGPNVRPAERGRWRRCRECANAANRRYRAKMGMQ